MSYLTKRFERDIYQATRSSGRYGTLRHYVILRAYMSGLVRAPKMRHPKTGKFSCGPSKVEWKAKSKPDDILKTPMHKLVKGGR